MTYSPKGKRRGQPAKAKPPEPGERRAFRKRIRLTNPNALPVPNTLDLGPQLGTQPECEGKVMSIPQTLLERLQTIGAFKSNQGWRYYSRPSMLIRRETLELAECVKCIASGKSAAHTVRSVIVGERGSGKSMHILQAMLFAMLKDWIVIHVPEAQDVTNAHTNYSPIPDTSPTVYFQQAYTAELLMRISAANPILRKLKATQRHDMPTPVPSGASLARLCSMGADPELTYPVFQALMSELSAPGRPPLLLSLDGLHHAMRLSYYRSASFEPIHAHSLYLISWFLDHLCGRRALPNGGMVLAAVSESNRPSAPTLSLRLEQLEQQQALARNMSSPAQDTSVLPYLQATGQRPFLVTQPDPYFEYDQRVLDTLSQPRPDPRGAGQSTVSRGILDGAVKVTRIGDISVQEARALVEYWAENGMMRTRIDDHISTEKWIVSGNGIIGELERGCVGVSA